MEIILASASPRRKELLERADVCFRILVSDGEEIITGTRPDEVVKELSYQKAMNVAESEEGKRLSAGTVLIGADTVVAYQGKILGKPADEEDAVRTLKELSGNVHQVYTGVTVLVKKEDGYEVHTFAEETDVCFYPVSEEKIRAYVKTKEPMDKAGSYGIQGKWGIYVQGIRGDYNNVVGLPVPRLLMECEKTGIDLRNA